ncbi:MAG: ATP-binding protein [Acidobacteria bacterium]|nr:ATP-binding protein [Acidobacteriota bacterium]
MNFLRQTIPSRLEEAEALLLRVRTFLQAAGASSIAFPVELLARECVVNAIVHGNRRNADNSVGFSLRVGRKWVRLEVSDEGAGFPWKDTIRKRSGVRSRGGRGLHLCRLYADRVSFNQQGNRIALWIGRTRKES